MSFNVQVSRELIAALTGIIQVYDNGDRKSYCTHCSRITLKELETVAEKLSIRMMEDLIDTY